MSAYIDCRLVFWYYIFNMPFMPVGVLRNYIDSGTNDKDTNEQVFAPDEAKTKAEEILLKHVGGWTIREANGGWADGEMLYRE